MMTSQYRSPESYAVFNVGGRAMFRVPIATSTRVTRIIGRPTVQAVEVEKGLAKRAGGGGFVRRTIGRRRTLRASVRRNR